MSEYLIIPMEHRETIAAALAVVRNDMIDDGTQSSTNVIDQEEYRQILAAIEAMETARDLALARENVPPGKFAIEFGNSGEPKEIGAFVHCGQCIAERPDGVSPRDFAQLEVGYTRDGIQVWCRRHETNVVHLKWARDDYKVPEAQVRHERRR